MTQNASQKSCFVIHSRHYRESSLLLELLTEDSEYVAAVLKGAKSPNGQSIDLLTLYEISWRRNAQLANVTHSECLRVYQIKGKRLYASLYLNELIKRSMRQGTVVEGLFESYRNTLTEFEHSEGLLESSLRRFEKKLLSGLGYELVLNVESELGREVEPDSSYRFVMGTGLRLCESTSESSFDGRTLLAIARDDYREATTRRAAKLILREALQFHIGSSPLNSKQLFQTTAS